MSEGAARRSESSSPLPRVWTFLGAVELSSCALLLVLVATGWKEDPIGPSSDEDELMFLSFLPFPPLPSSSPLRCISCS